MDPSVRTRQLATSRLAANRNNFSFLSYPVTPFDVKIQNRWLETADESQEQTKIDIIQKQRLFMLQLALILLLNHEWNFCTFFFFSNTLFSQSRNNYLVWKSLDTSYHETNLIKVILCERENKLSWTEHQKNLTYKWEMLLSVHKTVTQYIKFEPSGQTRKSSSRPNLL